MSTLVFIKIILGKTTLEFDVVLVYDPTVDDRAAIRFQNNVS